MSKRSLGLVAIHTIKRVIRAGVSGTMDTNSKPPVTETINAGTSFSAKDQKEFDVLTSKPNPAAKEAKEVDTEAAKEASSVSLNHATGKRGKGSKVVESDRLKKDDSVDLV